MIRFETHKLGFLFFYSDVLGNSSKNLRIKYCSNSGNWFSASIMDFHDWKKVSAFLKIERRGMYGRVGWRFLRRGLVVSMVLGIGSMCSVLEYIQVSARQDDKYWSLGKSASIYSPSFDFSLVKTNFSEWIPGKLSIILLCTLYLHEICHVFFEINKMKYSVSVTSETNVV